MRGYLQRIAACAVRPQPRMHPFVESIFPAARVESAPAPLVRSEMQAAAANVRASEPGDGGEGEVEAASKPVAPPAGAGAAKGFGTRPNVPQVASAEGRVAGPVAAGRESFRPLLPEVVQEMGAAGDELRKRTEGGGESARSADARSGDARSGDASSAGAWKFEPLVAEAGGEVAGQGVSESARSGDTAGFLHPARDGAPVDGARGVSRLRSAAQIAAGRRTAQPQAEQRGDEIQIHIGRVEVIAMPAVAPRAAPAPARKSQTLDEYLRQGRGRAR